MASISSISLSGIRAAQVGLNTAAHNGANVNTDGFRRQQVRQTSQVGGGVDTHVSSTAQEGSALEADLVGQIQAKHAFLANVAVLKTSNSIAGTLLDEMA